MNDLEPFGNAILDDPQDMSPKGTVVNKFDGDGEGKHVSTVPGMRRVPPGEIADATVVEITEPRPPAADDNKPVSRFNAVKFDDVEFDLTSSYLIKGLIDTEGSSLVFGESGTAKTFFALDLAVHVALGRWWFGRRVQQMAVVYIAAEAGASIRRRVIAIRNHLSETEGETGPFPILIIPTAVNLQDPAADLQPLIKEIQQYEHDEGMKVGLVIVDTLSRAMNGGNENAPDDMGKFVANCDLLRKSVQAHLMMVHHSGKDTTKGARGHSLLRAAVDTEIEMTARTSADKTKMSGATVTKQRDGETGGVFGFELLPVNLGKDQDGDTVTSCVIKPVDADLLRPPVKLTGHPKLALECIQFLLSTDPKPMPCGVDYPSTGHPHCVYLSDFRERFYKEAMPADKPDTQQKAFSRARNKLKELKIIGGFGDYVWLAGQTGHDRTK